MNKISLGILSKPQCREAGTNGGRTISGYAIIFGKPSVVMTDYWDGLFREYIDKGAISQTMLNKADVQFTIWHDREMLLARHHSDGTGTLKLNVDSYGVRYEFESPHTPAGDTAVELVKRGDIIGASFSFYESDAKYTTKNGTDGIPEKHIVSLSNIFEMTLASDPAYPDTSANVREKMEQEKKFKEQLESMNRTIRRQEAELELQDLKKKMATY